MLVDVIAEPTERRAAVAERIATYVVGQRAKQLAGNDPAVLLLNLRDALCGAGLTANQADQAVEAVKLAERMTVAAEADALGRCAPLVLAAGLFEE